MKSNPLMATTLSSRPRSSARPRSVSRTPQPRTKRPTTVASPAKAAAVPATGSRTTTTLAIEGRSIPVSNLGKILYPETGFTKGDVIQYYIAIAPVLLPHLEARALTMKRYPDGVDHFFFYEKNCPPYRPHWLKTARVPSKRNEGDMHYCVIDTLPGLVWAANLADLELHVSLARSTALQRPTAMVFDLDPGEGTTVLDCARVAFRVRDALAAAKLESFPKTSGSKGIQLYVPLNTAATFDETKHVAHELALALEQAHPREIVSNMRKELRRGKVLIDWSQNDDHKTTVCVYSLRATKSPGVSTPLTWKELETAARRGRVEDLRFSPADVLARVKKHGDLFAPVLSLKQRLGRA